MREALNEYPGARGLEHFLTGADADAIMEQARELHERAGAHDTESEPDLRTQAQQLYGRAGTGGGALGVPVLSTPERENERRMFKIAQEFNEAPRDAYGQRIGIRPSDIDFYTRERGIEHLRNQVLRWAVLSRSDLSARYGG